MKHLDLHRICYAFFGTAIFGLAAAIVPIAAAQTASAADKAETAMQVSPGLILPPMNPTHGKELYASKGCVVCHAINGVGGTDAPDISAKSMAPEMNPFDFVAKMWNHAQGMVAMQEDELGGQITFENGQEIADIIAFLHDAAVQKTFGEDDIPANIKEKLDSDESEGGMGSGVMKGDMKGHMEGGEEKGKY
jgi:cytochrome c